MNVSATKDVTKSNEKTSIFTTYEDSITLMHEGMYDDENPFHITSVGEIDYNIRFYVGAFGKHDAIFAHTKVNNASEEELTYGFNAAFFDLSNSLIAVFRQVITLKAREKTQLGGLYSEINPDEWEKITSYKFTVRKLLGPDENRISCAVKHFNELRSVQSSAFRNALALLKQDNLSGIELVDKLVSHKIWRNDFTSYIANKLKQIAPDEIKVNGMVIHLLPINDKTYRNDGNSERNLDKLLKNDKFYQSGRDSLYTSEQEYILGKKPSDNDRQKYKDASSIFYKYLTKTKEYSVVVNKWNRKVHEVCSK